MSYPPLKLVGFTGLFIKKAPVVTGGLSAQLHQLRSLLAGALSHPTICVFPFCNSQNHLGLRFDNARSHIQLFAFFPFATKLGAVDRFLVVSSHPTICVFPFCNTVTFIPKSHNPPALHNTQPRPNTETRHNCNPNAKPHPGLNPHRAYLGGFYPIHLKHFRKILGYSFLFPFWR